MYALLRNSLHDQESRIKTVETVEQCKCDKREKNN